MSRLKVIVGEYKVGDKHNDRIITGFGKSWIEKKASDKHFKGQLWEECERCGTEPVYLPHVLCEKCVNRFYGELTEVCYAYFDNKEEEEQS